MNEREDYLDRLLRGVEDSPEDSSEDDALFDFDSAADEDDFLKAFERSLSDSPATADPDLDKDFDMDEIDDIVSHVKSGDLDGLEDGFSHGNGAADADSQEFMVNTMDGEGSHGMEDASQELDDLLSGFGEEDSMDSFGAEEGGQDSFGEEGASQKDDLDSMAEELAKEMDELDLGDGGDDADDFPDYTPDVESDPGKEKKEKKGFLQRLAIALFGEDEEEEEDGAISEAKEMGGISDENLDILKELDQGAAEESEKDRKKREKQEQKAQKKKEKAEKKAQKAKEKQAKPKKEKKPKEPKVVEKTKPLPRVPVILITLVGVSLVLLVNLFSSQVGYATSVSEAKDYYSEGDYISAYDSLGRNSKVRAADEELYHKARITAYLQQQIVNYSAYQRYGLYVEALNSLVCGVGRYDINAAEAAEIGVEAEYEEMLAQIEEALQENYSMGLEEARELYNIRDKEEFTYTVYGIIDHLGLIR